MKRVVLLVLSCMLLLTGCSFVATTKISEEKLDVIPTSTAETTVVETFGTEADGFCLTYPASFELSESGEDYYVFTDEQQDLSISLSIEENTYANIPAEEYPQAMGLEMYSKMLSENSFDRDIYVKDEESSYSIYTLTDEYIYCVEYNYQGEPGQDVLISQIDFEAYGEFSGFDNTDTLMSYAQVYLEDMMGSSVGYVLTHEGKRTINSQEMTVFQVHENKKLVCLIAVNSEGLCYVDRSTTGEKFVNIELLLYDTTENTTDRLLYYTMYYYEALYGTASADIVLYDADYYYNNQHLTVYAVSVENEMVCHIAVSDDGVGYIDYSGACGQFEKIEY